MKKLLLILICISYNSFAKEYTVIKGDTLYSISKKYNLTIQDLLKCNDLEDNHVLKINEVLKICENEEIVIQENKKENTLASLIEKSQEELKFTKPNNGLIISSFGKQINGLQNDGINIFPSKSNKVLSAYNGHVIYAGENLKGYGNTIIIKHDENYLTIYSHLNNISVSEGDFIEEGKEIGQTGNSGKFKKEQLHFEIRKNLRPLNPEKHFKK